MNPIQRCLPVITIALAACGGGGADTASTGAAVDAAAQGGSPRAVDKGRSGAATLPPLVVAAGQETVHCVNASIGALSLDTVFVPDDASCELFGTRLKGSIQVGRLATVLARDVVVDGSLQAEGSALVIVEGASSFGGSVQVKQGGAATLSGTRIEGDLQLDAMSGSVLAQANRIGGSLQAVGNRGGLTLLANTMNGNLQCQENLPAPTGGGNQAASKENQCAGL